MRAIAIPREVAAMVRDVAPEWKREVYNSDGMVMMTRGKWGITIDCDDSLDSPQHGHAELVLAGKLVTRRNFVAKGSSTGRKLDVQEAVQELLAVVADAQL